MGIYIAAASLICAAVVQVSALSYSAGNGVAIDLILILVVAWGIIKGVQDGLLWGLIGGLALDILSGAPFGANMMVLGAVGALSGVRRLRFLHGFALWPLFMVVAGTIAADGILLGVLTLLGRPWQGMEAFESIALPAAALNAIVVLPVYGLLLLIHRRTQPKVDW